MINKLSEEIHQNAKNKGFFDNKRNIGEMLALIHSEVSEALEADRNNKYAKKGHAEGLIGVPSPALFNSLYRQNIKDSFGDELADIVIRVMDLAAYKEIDLESHIRVKVRFNSTRPHKHGKKY